MDTKTRVWQGMGSRAFLSGEDASARIGNRHAYLLSDQHRQRRTHRDQHDCLTGNRS